MLRGSQPKNQHHLVLTVAFQLSLYSLVRGCLPPLVKRNRTFGEKRHRLYSPEVLCVTEMFNCNWYSDWSEYQLQLNISTTLTPALQRN